MGDDVHQRLPVKAAVGRQEVRDGPAKDFLAPISHLGEPTVARVHDPGVAVDGVHHGRGIAVQVPVLVPEARPIAHFHVHRHRSAVVVDDDVGKALDQLARPRTQVHGYTTQAARPAQQGQVVVLYPPRHRRTGQVPGAKSEDFGRVYPKRRSQASLASRKYPCSSSATSRAGLMRNNFR